MNNCKSEFNNLGSRRKNMLLKLFFLLALLFYGIQLLAQNNISENYRNCFTVLAGKNTTVDGSVLLAHNEDDGGKFLVDWYKVPRISHKSGEKLILQKGAELEQAEETYGFLWLEIPSLQFSDSYINEWGVTIVSNGCPSKETEGELTDGGIGYYLRRIMAERAKTAKEAVKIAGEIIDKFGYLSSGRTYSIADVNEAWMLAVVKGKHWVAQRLPDDSVAVIPNYYTITKINLKDTVNFLGSPDIIDYAIKKGWYNPSCGNDFNFRLAYGSEQSLHALWNIPRHMQAINLLSEKQYGYYNQLPTTFRPKGKVSVKTLETVLENHYEGTQFEMNPEYNNGNPHKNIIMRICSASNRYGFVAQLRNWMPVDIGAVLWIAPRRPCVQPFTPWYLGIEKIPEEYSRGDYKKAIKNHFNNSNNLREQYPNHAYWTFVDYSDRIDSDYTNRINKIKESKVALEKDLLNNQTGFEKEVLNIYKKNPKTARLKLTEYTSKIANEIFKNTEKEFK